MQRTGETVERASVISECDVLVNSPAVLWELPRCCHRAVITPASRDALQESCARHRADKRRTSKAMGAIQIRSFCLTGSPAGSGAVARFSLSSSKS
jgi:hypothetical protein